MRPLTSIIFQKEPGDRCTWLEEEKFWKANEKIKKEQGCITEENLKQTYRAFKKAFRERGITHAAIGGFVFTLYGARNREDLRTYDLDIMIDSEPMVLFDVLRNMKDVRLKLGLQKNNFRVHYKVAEELWVGVDLLIAEIKQTVAFKDLVTLSESGLLKTKLKSFDDPTKRITSKDANDICFIIESQGGASGIIDNMKWLSERDRHLCALACDMEGSAHGLRSNEREYDDVTEY